jgi:hypothetical protein
MQQALHRSSLLPRGFVVESSYSDGVSFFDKVDTTAGRGLRRDMTDVFASAGGVATTIFGPAR